MDLQTVRSTSSCCPTSCSSNLKSKEHIKLIVACIIALLFVIGEVIGGYFANSLAIMTDAAHMLSDFVTFLIGLFSICVAARIPPSKRLTFGWHRAEVLGAFISVLLIWLIVGILVYEAVLRIISKQGNIDADIMLITATVGVYVNVLLCMVLRPHHDHGRHDHEPADNRNSKELHDFSKDDSADKKRWWKRLSKTNRRNKINESKSIVLRAAFIHVIGDLLLSIGVVIAGYIIKFFPQWHIVDPICTFLFSILVIISTLNVLRDAILVLMEGAPRNIDTEAIENDLKNLANVVHAHSIHIWSLTMSKAAIAAHLAIGPNVDSQLVLNEASNMLKTKYGFIYITLQVQTM